MVFNISTTIDFVGQRQSEKIFQYLMTAFAVVGFAWGFHVQQFSQTLIILAAGVGVSSVIILPPWPFWNRNQLKWQKPVPKSTENSASSSSASATTSTDQNQSSQSSPRNKKQK